MPEDFTTNDCNCLILFKPSVMLRYWYYKYDQQPVISLRVNTFIQSDVCVNMLQTGTSPLSVHPLQGTQATSLECRTQMFHSVSVTTLQPGKG